jgi:hypothetical protein
MYSIATCALYAGVAGLLGLQALAASAQTDWPITALTPSSAVAPGAAWPPSPWVISGLPPGRGGTLPLTRFEPAADGAGAVLNVTATASYGVLSHPLQPAQPLTDGVRMAWRWQIVQPVAGADVRTKAGDDAPLKVCVALDVPRARLGWFNRSLLALAESVTGAKLPTATLCYVWDAALPVGTVLPNIYTDRVRLWVVASGAQAVGRWESFERHLASDVRHAFGAEAEPLPAVTAVVIGADADNTGQQGRAMLDALRVWQAGAR